MPRTGLRTPLSALSATARRPGVRHPPRIRAANSKFGRTFGLTRHLAERANRTSKALHGPTAPDNSSLALQGTSTALPTSLPSCFSKALRALNFGGITPRTSLSSSKFRGLLLALSVPLFCTFGIFGTSMAFGTGSAFAGEPWWHLTSGERPTDLHAGGEARDEVQEMTVSATEGDCSSCTPWWKITEH